MKTLLSAKLFKMKNPKKVAIVYRIHSKESVIMATKITQWLLKKKIAVYTAPEQKPIPRTKTIVSSNDLKKMGLVIVLGGDGTYLRAVRLVKSSAVPVIGFNMGSLGFLTTQLQSEVFEMLTKTLKNEMTVTKLPLLKAIVKTQDQKKFQFEALNDFVIERGSFSQLISTQIFYGGTLINDVKADGIIISSPTGSTAYNLAAGGPILQPSVNALIVTPVAPHSLTTRPLILSSDEATTLKLNPQTSTAHLIVDGQKVFELSPDDEVTISKSKNNHLAVRKPSYQFFDLLKEKLKFGDRYVTGA